MRVHLLVFVVLCLFVMSFLGIAAASEPLLIEVQIEPGFAIEVPENLVFAGVAPGETLEETIQVVVKSNTDWALSVTGQKWVEGGGGENQDINSVLEFRDDIGLWRELRLSEHTVRGNEPPTAATGQPVDVDFRFTADFGDPPGNYMMEVLFTVVPQI